MKAKIIKTKAEYEAALARIDKLMDAVPNTPPGDELELLSLLVHDYEAFGAFGNETVKPPGSYLVICHLKPRLWLTPNVLARDFSNRAPKRDCLLY